MKDMTYYVVEVSFRKTNPIHRAICHHRHHGWVDLYGYEHVISKNIEELTYFNVVEEIPSMTADFENKFKLPKEDNNGIRN